MHLRVELLQDREATIKECAKPSSRHD
jgi:hypothetical protein